MWRALVAWSMVAFALAGGAQTSSGSIGGKVLDTYGQGIPAYINVFQEKAEDGLPYLQQRCHVRSNATGQFMCPPVPAGKYLVREIPILVTRKPPGVPMKAASAVFYPGVSDLTQAEAIPVIPGGLAWAQIRVPDVPTVFIAGILIPKAPEAAFALYAAAGGLTVDVGVHVQYDAQTGKFKASGLMPGHYLLEPDWLVNNFEHRAYVPIDIGTKSLRHLRVRPLSNAKIEGQIASADGTDVSEVVLHRIDGLIPPYRAAVKGNSFYFDDVASGAYVLDAIGRGDTYVGSISINGQPTEDARFQLVQEATYKIDVTLISPACEIEGSVTPWASTATVADVVAVSEDTGIVYHALTGAQRRFTITGLPPGSYRVFAWPGRNLVPYRIASVRSKYKDRSVEVSLSEGTISEPVTLSPAGPN